MPFFILIMLSCFALCVLFLVFLIPRLKKRAQQPIYAEGPDWHLKKQGTPTMGGVGFLLGILICALAICPYLFQIGKKETALSNSGWHRWVKSVWKRWKIRSWQSSGL